MNSTRIDTLIAVFDTFDGVYKRDELEEAITLKEEITPRLINILESIAEDPASYAREDHYANVYAVTLLASFQDPAAHLPIICAFCVPQRELEQLWGDMITETLPALLLRTCNGNFDSIRQLILNRETYGYVRSAAIRALTYGVAYEQIERQDVIDFLSGLLSGSEADEGSNFWNAIVSALTNLYPVDVMDKIRSACDRCLIDPMYINMDDVEQSLDKGVEGALSQLRSDADYRVPNDIHSYIAAFAAFNKNPSNLQAPVMQPASTLSKVRQNRRKQTRSKNKQAKKSRKKNRR